MGMLPTTDTWGRGCLLAHDQHGDPDREYSFDELSKSAQQHAIGEWRQHEPHDDWWDFTVEDFTAIGKMLGIEFTVRSTRALNGKMIQEPNVWFSVSYSQGDGACFEGTWTPPDEPFKALCNVIDHAPCDTDLHDIAFDILEIAERLGPNSYDQGGIEVTIAHSGFYYHEHSVVFSEEYIDPEAYDDWNELQRMVWDALARKRGLYEVETNIQEPMRRLMRWLHRRLVDEYEHLTSDESAREYLADMTFDSEGNSLS